MINLELDDENDIDNIYEFLWNNIDVNTITLINDVFYMLTRLNFFLTMWIYILTYYLNTTHQNSI